MLYDKNVWTIKERTKDLIKKLLGFTNVWATVLTVIFIFFGWKFLNGILINPSATTSMIFVMFFGMYIGAIILLNFERKFVEWKRLMMIYKNGNNKPPEKPKK